MVTRWETGLASDIFLIRKPRQVGSSRLDRGETMGKGNRKRQAKEAAANLSYWHGGFRGRVVGDQLIPGIEVPGYGGQFAAALASSEWMQDYRPDFVYVTTDRDLAYDFAAYKAMLGHGATLYRVEPLGKPIHDPDYPKGISFRCSGARVVAVEAEGIDHATTLSGAAHGYMTWDDGSPVYDDEGYPLPSKGLKHLGASANDLQTLGTYTEFEEIQEFAIRLVFERNPGITIEEIRRVRKATGGKMD